MVNRPCPCGSHIKYKKCCRPFHKDKIAKDALHLMKSHFFEGKRSLVLSLWQNVSLI